MVLFLLLPLVVAVLLPAAVGTSSRGMPSMWVTLAARCPGPRNHD